MAVVIEKIVKEDLNLGFGAVDVTMPAGGVASGTQIGLHTFTDVVNIKDFGAVGNGVADDTDAIQTAINTGFPVYVPTGTFLTNKLRLPDGGYVYGSGYGSCLKLRPNQLTSVIVNANHQATSTANTRLTVRDLRIDGNHAQNAGDTPQEDGGAITFFNVDGFLVQGVYMLNCRAYGIFVGWSQYGVSPAPQGPSRRGLILHNVVEECGMGETNGIGGICCTNGEYITIAHNLVKNVYNIGIRVESQNLNLGDQQNYYLVHGNQIKSDLTTVFTGIASVGRNTVANGGLCVGHTLTDNIVTGGAYGVIINNCGHFSVTGNQILDVALDGITLQSGSSQGIISDNHLRTPGRYGITNGGAGDNPITCLIKGNNISNSGSHGIYFDRGEEMTIVDNIVKNAGWGTADTADAIQVSAATAGNSDHWLVRGNQILDSVGNMRHGIYLSNAGFSDWLVDANYIQTARQYGVLANGLQACQITNNVIREVGTKTAATYAGIFVSALAGRPADDNLIHGNSIHCRTSTIEVGIELAAGASTTDRNVVRNNVIHGATFSNVYFTNGLGTNFEGGNVGGATSGDQGLVERLAGGFAPRGTVATLTAGYDVIPSAGRTFYLNPNGATRNVNPVSGAFVAGHEVIIVNTGAETLTFDSPALAAAILGGQAGVFSFDGTSWRKVVIA